METGLCREIDADLDIDMYAGFPCIPGLRAQRDEARRELLEATSGHPRDEEARVRRMAASRGWSYLYPTAEDSSADLEKDSNETL